MIKEDFKFNWATNLVEFDCSSFHLSGDQFDLFYLLLHELQPIETSELKKRLWGREGDKTPTPHLLKIYSSLRKSLQSQNVPFTLHRTEGTFFLKWRRK